MMKLSEAIRLGAMLRPQGFHNYFYHDGSGSCALGSAAEAAGLFNADNFEEHVNKSQTLTSAFPLLPQFVPHPHSAFRGRRMSLDTIVPCLNDNGWTRERIADWVQTIEDSLPQTPERAEPVQDATLTEAETK
ncbi:MAG TPA: hypothetical protein VNH19_05710 [Candidatus Limnocylindrales bacterium]|nr:hypothetical protein [Candidatus Limnocylindrales bacterium]